MIDANVSCDVIKAMYLLILKNQKNTTINTAAVGRNIKLIALSRIFVFTMLLFLS